jgi:hypothetical protein
VKPNAIVRKARVRVEKCRPVGLALGAYARPDIVLQGRGTQEGRGVYAPLNNCATAQHLLRVELVGGGENIAVGRQLISHHESGGAPFAVLQIS